MDIGLWLPLWEIVEERYHDNGAAALDEDERLWRLLRHTIDEVEHQGLLGFFVSEQPPEPQVLLTALQYIGAEEMSNVFERALALLPGAMPPQDEEARDLLIDLWQDEAYAKILHELEDDFFELLPQTEQLLDPTVRRILEKYHDADE